jgi:signal transduction histidine kinase
MHALHGTSPARFQPDLDGWARLVHPDDLPRVRRETAAAFAGRVLLDTDYRIVRHDGSVRMIRAFGRARQGDDNALVGTNWDVTDEREAVERLRLANAHVDQFATIASHDLQAPLRQITLWADLLRHEAAGRLNDDDLEIVDRIQRRARHMRRMIVGLLEFSRAGTDIDLTVVDLTDIATEVVSDYARELAEIGGTAMVTPIPHALADPLMVSQIFANLVSNAIKYRSDRPLEIVIGGHTEPGSIVVTVRDNGIGIDPLYAETVFELFRRTPASSSLEGSGVGLAVCQRMAAAMGGSIVLDPRTSGGSEFRLCLRPAPGMRQQRTDDVARSSAA